MKNGYDDIMNLPHYVSPTRPQMPMADRAAQFSPFAALVGYDAVIQETGRLTDAKIQLEEDALTELDRNFRLLAAHLEEGPKVKIAYFKADPRKSGGAYHETTGIVQKLDVYRRQVILEDGTFIPMDDILKMERDDPASKSTCPSDRDTGCRFS